MTMKIPEKFILYFMLAIYWNLKITMNKWMNETRKNYNLNDDDDDDEDDDGIRIICD